MGAQQQGGYSKCAHAFVGRIRWRRNERYHCVKCGFTTRRYDSIDHRGLRPVHPHMSVAVRGFNTVGNRSQQVTE